MPIDSEVVPKPTYPQNWPAYNRAQTRERELFQRLLFALCQEIEEPPRKDGAGRNRLPLSDMLFAVVFKTYSVVSGRRFISELKEVTEKGYITKTPHYNSIFNYFEHDSMNWILRDLIIDTSKTLTEFEVDFAADSSGFSTGQFSRWFVEKHRGIKNKWTNNRINWLKCHLMCGVKTNIVTAVEITSRNAADTTQFPALLGQTSLNFKLNHVSADKAYQSEKNLELVNEKGGVAFIPFKKRSRYTGATARAHGDVWKTMYAYFYLHKEQFMEFYHKRSNVETTFSMIKGKFGERLRSKTYISQENEILAKILCHNICCVIHAMYELGIEPEFLKEK